MDIFICHQADSFHCVTTERDAGHGVGMDIVKSKVEQLRARLRISSRENAFTQFSIHFAA
jgi:sensor histidine kinase regulating citrate/malate metabolism